MDGEPSTSGNIPDADRVGDLLRANGQLEKLRTQALERLEQDPVLRQCIEDAVRRSHAFRDFRGDKSNKQLISQLQNELSPDLSREALRALWRVLSEGPEGGGISPHIDAAVHAALCRQRDAELQPKAAEPPQ